MTGAGTLVRLSGSVQAGHPIPLYLRVSSIAERDFEYVKGSAFAKKSRFGLAVAKGRAVFSLPFLFHIR